MKKYFVIFEKSIKSQFIYRVSMLFGAVSSLLSFLIQISLWFALLGKGSKAGASFTDMVVFLIINTIVLTITRANITGMVEASVIDGSVSMHLLRPVKYKYFLLSSIIGQNTYKLIINIFPIIFISFFIIDFSVMPAWIYLLAFLVSVTIGMLIMFEISYIVGLLAFWIQRCWFLNWYLSAGLVFFGGTAVPLWLYPHTLNSISYFLPFRYITFEPINIFLQKTSAGSLWTTLTAGIAWLLVLTLIDKLIWHMATYRLSVNGG